MDDLLNIFGFVFKTFMYSTSRHTCYTYHLTLQ